MNFSIIWCPLLNNQKNQQNHTKLTASFVITLRQIQNMKEMKRWGPAFGSDKTMEGKISLLFECKGCDPKECGDCWVVGGKCLFPPFDIHSWKKKEHSGTYGQTWTLIVHDYLPIMASSVLSEHVFSSAGITISKWHNRLKLDIVEALQCLKCLYHFSWCTALLEGGRGPRWGGDFRFRFSGWWNCHPGWWFFMGPISTRWQWGQCCIEYTQCTCTSYTILVFFFSASHGLSPSQVWLWAGLGSELRLEIYQAWALESQAKATASRPSQAVTSLLPIFPSARVMTRIVIVGLYYKSKIVGLTPDSGIECQNSAVLSPGSGIVSQKWDVPYLPKWWSMRRRKWIFVFTQQAFYASQRSYIP